MLRLKRAASLSEHANDSGFIETLLVAVIIGGEGFDAEDPAGGFGLETQIQVQQDARTGRSAAEHLAIFQIHHRRIGLEMGPAAGRIRVQELSVERIEQSERVRGLVETHIQHRIFVINDADINRVKEAPAHWMSPFDAVSKSLADLHERFRRNPFSYADEGIVVEYRAKSIAGQEDGVAW